MIRCGWCGYATEPDRCSHCDRDPVLPYEQRGTVPIPVEVPVAGRPEVDVISIRSRLAEADKVLGHGATTERLAEWLGVSTRTLRRWRERIDGR